MCKWDLNRKIRLQEQNPGEMVLSVCDFNKHVRRQIDDFRGVDIGCRFGKRHVGKDCLSFAMKRSCVWQAHCLKKE